MTSAIKAADAANSGAAVPIMLTELRLPTIKRLWADLAAQSNREGSHTGHCGAGTLAT
jgi:hypothetical protein